jgi:polyisoprenoid-binding protein YceI
MKKSNLLIIAALFIVGTTLSAQSFTVDTKKSTLKWTGKKVTGEHYGFIKLKSGNFEIKNNKIVKGTFEIDMTTISNTDIKSDEHQAKLVGHLKSDDFFGVEKHPTAKLVISESSSFKNNKAKVSGKLTIKNISHQVDFIAEKSNNGYSTTIVVDRSKYDVKYGSGSFFDNLGDNMIYDDFTMEVQLVTQ